jgi:secreted trypsin-like serine protease
MHPAVIVLLALASYCNAKPSIDVYARATISFEGFVIGGTDADPGEFPWQLSQQRQGSTGTWSHSCGASLLSSRYGLSAAHCVDGAAVSILRVIAGINDRLDPNAVPVNIASYKMNENYNNGDGSFANDIAILTFAGEITPNGDNIQLLTLPADNSNNFAGDTCVISGWGRTSASNVLPELLQKAPIGIITTDECNTLLASVSGATATDKMICLYDTLNNVGSCNGDSGGPLNCDADGTRVVAGVTSWGISSLGACSQRYPSVYTRTSAYLQWIADNSQ